MEEREELKTWPEFFEPVWDGIKKFEVRQDDRGYKAGQFWKLREWIPQSQEYTGRWMRIKITYVLYGPKFMIPADTCVFSFQIIQRGEDDGKEE